MSKRKERRKQADKKRDYYKSAIALLIQTETHKKLEAGYSERAALSEGINSGFLRIGELIKISPHEAHMIRQAALEFKRGIEGLLNGDTNAG